MTDVALRTKASVLARVVRAVASDHPAGDDGALPADVYDLVADATEATLLALADAGPAAVARLMYELSRDADWLDEATDAARGES